MIETSAPADEVGYAGLRLFCLLYGGTKTDTLTSLRYASHCKVYDNDGKVKQGCATMIATNVQHITIGYMCIFKSSGGLF